MEVYVLDEYLRRIAVIDRYESFIWTDKFQGFGDFELVIHSDMGNRRLLTAGTRLVTNDSDRVMTVETIEDSDKNGQTLLSIKGSSLEEILEERVATDNMLGLTSNPNWVLMGTPGNICREIYQKICVDGILSPTDIIPFRAESMDGYPPVSNTISEPNSSISIGLEVMTVYEAIKQVCETYGLGFRLVRKLKENDLAGYPTLHFEVYSGNDRTMTQTNFAPVVFSPDLDNLSNTTELTSIATYKNVAYVFSKNGSEIVYAPGVDPTMAGFNKRIALVKADSELPAGPDLTTFLRQKGLEVLTEHRSVSAFDGEIAHFGSYKYGVDYQLGDLVEMRNADGVATNMRVTEQIFVSDAEGERSYPTLSVELVVTPGSWFEWDHNQVWEDATQTWDEA